MWWRGLIIAGVLAGLAITAAGIFRIVQNETGTRADATVSECHGVDTRYTHVTCTGTWIVGGSLLGSGHVVVGDISGASSDDVGKTLHVTVRNGVAYTRGLLLPIVLIGIGVLVAGGTGLLGVALRSPSAKPAPAISVPNRP
jgi:hypothetical protein